MDDTHRDAMSWLQLAGVERVGPVLGRRLAGALGGPAAVLAAPRDTLVGLGAPRDVAAAIVAADGVAIERSTQRWLDGAPRRTLVGIDGSAYPSRLKALPDAPLALLVEGSLEALASPQLAVVGSRSPTRAGVETAREFAGALVRSGLAVTSGLARGIDAAAHRGALLAGGTTVAVLGHGPDRVYPEEHRDLAVEIVAAGGALVSEFPPGTAVQRGNFPRRNRVISGLALGVLVVEAATRSGSLITARSALEQGREVFAIPGSIHNPMARGCHRLIRDGAKLTETIGDVLEEINVPGVPEPAPPDASTWGEDNRLDEDYVTLLAALGFDPAPVDVLVERTGLTPQALSSMLFRLELDGFVCPVPGAGYMRTGKRD